jgi:hypothetical protein
VRDRTSSTASTPEPISAKTPSHSQARASRVGTPGKIFIVCQSTSNMLLLAHLNQAHIANHMFFVKN